MIKAMKLDGNQLEDFLQNFAPNVRLETTADGIVQLVSKDNPESIYIVAQPLSSADEIAIPTRLGDLTAVIGADASNPGVAIGFSPKGSDGVIDLAYAEVKDPELSGSLKDDAVHLYVWSDPNREDYTHQFTFPLQSVRHAMDADVQEAVIEVPAKVAGEIECALHPGCEEDALSEDETIVFTAKFEDGYEADLKVCGVQWQEGDDNSAWCEMVLFHNGAEVACTEPCDDFFQDWEIKHDGILYKVKVEVVEFWNPTA